MNLQVFKSQEQQIKAIIAQISQTIQQSNKPEFVIAISGGKSPISLFEQLNSLDLDFSKITFTLVDERIVDTTHSDSNENLAHTHLLKNNAKSAKFIGLTNLNLTPQKMIDHLNAKPLSIDLAILGMGEDGHTASIFPCCKELDAALNLNNSKQYILTNPQSAKYSRISLTLAALVKIPHLILSINGNTKLNVFKEAMLQNNLNYPISYVLSNKPSTQTFWSE